MESGQTADRMTGSVSSGGRSAPAPWQTWTDRVLRWALGALFIVAAAPKIAHPDLFAEAVNNYHWLPMTGVNWAVILLPCLEVVCGAALLAGVAVRGAAAWISALLVLFMIALASAIHRGLDISCGCFGTGDYGKRVGYEEVARDALLLAMTLIVWMFNKSKRKPTPLATPPQ